MFRFVRTHLFANLSLMCAVLAVCPAVCVGQTTPNPGSQSSVTTDTTNSPSTPSTTSSNPSNTQCPILQIAKIINENNELICIYAIKDCTGSAMSTSFASCSTPVCQCVNSVCDCTSTTVDLGIPNDGPPLSVSIQTTDPPAAAPTKYRVNKKLRSTTLPRLNRASMNPADWGKSDYVVKHIRNVRATRGSTPQSFALFSAEKEGSPTFYFGLRLADTQTTDPSASISRDLIESVSSGGSPVLSPQESLAVSTVDGKEIVFHLIGWR